MTSRAQRRAAASRKGRDRNATGVPRARRVGPVSGKSVQQTAKLLEAAVGLHQSGDLEQAERIYRQTLASEPDNADALHYLGLLMHQSGDSAGAVGPLRRSLELRPRSADFHSNFGAMLCECGRAAEAEPHCRKALALDPRNPEAHNNHGTALKALGRLEEAVAAYREAVRLKPDYAEAFNNLGLALLPQGLYAEAAEAFRRTLALAPGHAAAHTSLIFAMNYEPRFAAGEIFAESRRWNAAHAVPRTLDHAVAQAGAGHTHGNQRDPERRLRIGYLSPDFRQHSVGFFAEPLIAAHDRAAVEIFCYAQVAKPDDVTARFRDLADQWRSTVGMSEEDVARRIRADGIDIAVDLAGHTADSRLLALAGRPAPVQISYLGYANTTGMDAIDYRFTDAVADPEGAADRLHSETLVRLPNGFLCYAPAAAAPDVAPPPGVDAGAEASPITFGSFNALAKVTPGIVAVWSRILQRVPGARLVLKSGPLAGGQTRARYRALFAEGGIAAERVELVGPTPSLADHLAAYGGIDIALDPFPYNGTTTTCEAMWMGVPVVTLRGGRHAGRVGASLLTRVGLGELIAEDEAAYVALAAELAGDAGRLREYRAGLRDRLARSPLCDARLIAGGIEAAYREIWRRWCAGGAG